MFKFNQFSFYLSVQAVLFLFATLVQPEVVRGLVSGAENIA